MIPPAWVQDSIFYQIFPDRFANGDRENDPPNSQPWGSPPDPKQFQGGDLRGIIQKFDHLLNLGVNALYLNPIFLASSNHRYNTTDYLRIDPKLGSLADFRELLDLAHGQNVRIILDGVFNHCGRGFFAFSDLLENQEYSPYSAWFFINHFPIDAFGEGVAQDYQAWWGLKSLPKFNTFNPSTRRYLLDVARYWIDFGIDGWRLDVPNEIADGEFWSQFSQVVHTANPQAYLVGEIWDIAAEWVGEDRFHGLMNYPFREAVFEFLSGKWKLRQTVDYFENIISTYPEENLRAMYTLLGSHDTKRALTKVRGNIRKLKFALSLQFAFPGAAAVYYGDEIGLKGGKDPDCRAAFPWDQRFWNQEVFAYTQRLIALRKDHDALRRGGFCLLFVDELRSVFGFLRRSEAEVICVIANGSNAQKKLELDLSGLLQKAGLDAPTYVTELFDRREIPLIGGQIALALGAYDVTYLRL